MKMVSIFCKAHSPISQFHCTRERQRWCMTLLQIAFCSLPGARGFKDSTLWGGEKNPLCLNLFPQVSEEKQTAAVPKRVRHPRSFQLSTARGRAVSETACNKSLSLALSGNTANKLCLLEEEKSISEPSLLLCGCLSLVAAVRHVEKSLWHAFLRGQTV